MKRHRQEKAWRQIANERRKAANRVAEACRALSADVRVQPGISRTGHVTLRCPTCGKVCYADRESADAAVERIPDPMMAYFSERCGGWWHLATVRP